MRPLADALIRNLLRVLELNPRRARAVPEETGPVTLPVLRSCPVCRAHLKRGVFTFCWCSRQPGWLTMSGEVTRAQSSGCFWVVLLDNLRKLSDVLGNRRRCDFSAPIANVPNTVTVLNLIHNLYPGRCLCFSWSFVFLSEEISVTAICLVGAQESSKSILTAEDNSFSCSMRNKELHCTF